MIGSLFAAMDESCAEWETNPLTQERTRLYYGMSTKKAQKEMGKKDLHTSEGVEIIIKVEYNLKGWIENFADYLRSAMSYCNVNNISDFQKFSQVIHISQLSRLAFKK